MVVVFRLVWVLFFLGCSAEVDRHEIPAAFPARLWTAGWEYRYGPSPPSSGGGPAFALPPRAPDPAWHSTSSLYNPPGHQTGQPLWLRTQITAAESIPATLHLPGVFERCIAYWDGQPLPCFGLDAGSHPRQFPGQRNVFLPLGDIRSPRWLVLYLESSWEGIGLTGWPKLGGQLEIHAAVVQGGLPTFALAFTLITISICAIGIYILQRSNDAYIYFALSCFSMGVYLLARCSIRAYIIEDPRFWRMLEGYSLCIIAMSLSGSAMITFAGLSSVISKYLTLFFCAFALVSPIVVLTDAIHFELVLIWLLRCMLLQMLVLIAISVYGIVQKDANAQILGCGLVVGSIIGFRDMLMSLQYIPPGPRYFHYAAVALVLSVGVILIRRVIGLHRRLSDYSTIMQLNIHSSVYSGAEDQINHAVEKIRELLSAERSLLFVSDRENEEIRFLIGRNEKLEVITELVADTSYDRKLVLAVQKQQKPLVKKRKVNERRSGNTVLALAAPLLAQREFLGVLYLEAGSQRSYAEYSREDIDILLALGSQLALALLAQRTAKLAAESAAARSQADEQGHILDAIARMGDGDLSVRINIPENSPNHSLAKRLDVMRASIVKWQAERELRIVETNKLNSALLKQIESRSIHLIDIVVRGLQSSFLKKSQRVNFAPGELLNANYRIISCIGQGSAGYVYKAERVTDRQVVAIKVLHEKLSQKSLESFTQEARIMAKLSHKGLSSVIDMDITNEDVPCLVSEFVVGTSLVECFPQFNLVQRVEILHQICDVLLFIHDHGVVHCDLKPANIVVSSDAGKIEVKVLDFGSAIDGSVNHSISKKTNEEKDRSAEANSLLVGTPMYLAPELVAGSAAATSASDVFSFGVIAFEVLSGKMPFTIPSVILRHRGLPVQVEVLSNTNSQLPPLLSDLVMRCLADDANQRPGAAEICLALGKIRDQLLTLHGASFHQQSVDSAPSREVRGS